MVYFKISDGQVTRKFKVNPGEITYDQLQERIATLFPKALEGSKDLHLKYRDSDGDLITISTNDEFQEALAELSEDHVWKLQIHDHTRPSPSRPAPRMNVPSEFFFQPSQVPFGGFGGFGGFSDPGFGWGMRRPSFPWLAGNPWSNLEREFDKMLEEHSETLNALHNTGVSEGTEAKPETGQEGDSAVKRQSSDAADTTDGKIQIKNIGSWEPKEFDGPFGKGRIIGPVGYYVSWSSGPEAEERGEQTEEKKSNAEDSAASAKEPTEGMET